MPLNVYHNVGEEYDVDMNSSRIRNQELKQHVMGDQRIAFKSGYDIGHVFATYGEGSNLVFHEHIENENLWTEDVCLALCSLQKGSKSIS